MSAVEDMLAQHRKDCERRGLAAGTIYRAHRTLRAYARWLATNDRPELIDAGRDDFEAWTDSRRLSAGSLYVYTSQLATFYAWAEGRGLIAANPLAAIPRPLLPERLPRPMSPDDFANAYRQADDRMKAWLALGGYQGLRCKEIAGVRGEDLLLERDPPMLLVSNPKGRRQRLLPLHPETEAALRRHGIPRRGHLFTTSGGRPILPGTVSKYLNRYLGSVGVRSSAHTLRHLFGTEVYRRSRDIRVTQEMLGHADPKTTSIYAAFSPADAADAVRGLAYGVGHG